uniref:Uncharacterized protein n=1 Tax=Triticum urartu TaxID=4572 RepID=A0A8R7PCG0_TRIUA
MPNVGANIDCPCQFHRNLQLLEATVVGKLSKHLLRAGDRLGIAHPPRHCPGRAYI